MSLKKILYLLPQPYLLSRGSSFRAQATVNAIADLGYDLDLLAYPLGQNPRKMNYQVLRSAKVPLISSVKIGPSCRKLILDIPFALKARQLVRSGEYDLIHGVEEAAIIAAHLGKRYHVPYIYDMHSWMSQQIEDSKFVRNKLILNSFKKLELQGMNRARAIITVGPEMTKILQAIAPQVPAFTLPDCPLTFDQSENSEQATEIKTKFFSDPDLKILYTGNYHQYQGIDLLINSIAELKKMLQHGQNFKLLLVGGSAGEQLEIARYRELAAGLGVAENIVFCGEYPAEAMPTFMDQANILVSSRISGNNVPLKIYTYLSSGKLLVATRIPSHTQILNDMNCLLAEPNAAGLAKALHQGLFKLSISDKEQLVARAMSSSGQEQHQKFQKILADCYQYCIG